jgi:predicted phage-related endonuclease
MKTLRSEENKKLLDELIKVIKKRKQLESEEKLLKQYFKDKMKGHNTAKIGDWLITLTDRIKVTIDSSKLELELGKRIKKFQKTTEYKQFDIKQIKEN